MRKPYFDLSSDSEEEEHSTSPVSICILGAPKVGKTSFIKRLAHGSFSFYYQPTTTIEITTVTIAGSTYTFYDISAYHHTVRPNYFVNPDIILFMYKENQIHTVEVLPDLFDGLLPHINPRCKYEAFFVNQQFTSTEEEKTDARTFNVNNCGNEGFQRLMFAIKQVLT